MTNYRRSPSSIVNGVVIMAAKGPVATEDHSTSGPRTATVRSAALFADGLRLDAAHYQEEFVLARNRVFGSGFGMKTVGDLATAFVPPRTKLVTASTPSLGVPYLRAHDALDTLPTTSRYLVTARTSSADTYRLREGMLLTPSSGRNLGPLAYVGTYLSRFAMTDIMRIVPRSKSVGMFLLAYLMTDTGQALMRRGRTGTTVDHLSAADVMGIPVPWVTEALRRRSGAAIARAESLLDRARLDLAAVQTALHEKSGLPLPLDSGQYRSHRRARAFEVSSTRMRTRIDAAYYDPTVALAKRRVTDGGGVALHTCARLRMLGRYKRYYVAPGQGRPILSGSQLLQRRPVSLKHISDRSFKDPRSFVIERGWSLFTCDGRSEEALGSAAFTSSLWDGWMASNHVMRAIPEPHIHPGFLYAVLRSPYVQIQLKALATGSVVDALDEATAGEAVIPLLPKPQRDAIGRTVAGAWEAIADSVRIAGRAVAELDSVIRSAYERLPPPRDVTA